MATGYACMYLKNGIFLHALDQVSPAWGYAYFWECIECLLRACENNISNGRNCGGWDIIKNANKSNYILCPTVVFVRFSEFFALSPEIYLIFKIPNLFPDFFFSCIL